MEKKWKMCSTTRKQKIGLCLESFYENNYEKYFLGNCFENYFMMFYRTKVYFGT